MFAIHYLKKMAASFFTDKNSNRKHISKEKGCNLRQIRGKSCKEARYGSSRIKGEIQRNKKKKRNIFWGLFSVRNYVNPHIFFLGLSNILKISEGFFSRHLTNITVGCNKKNHGKSQQTADNFKNVQSYICFICTFAFSELLIRIFYPDSFI